MHRRIIVWLALALVAAPLAPAAEPHEMSPEELTWLGKVRHDVERAWGEPTRVRREAGGGATLIYKIRFYSDRDLRLGGEVPYGRVGVGPSDSHDTPERWVRENYQGGTVLGPSPGQPVIGKRTAMFFLDADGKVQRCRIDPTRWKKGYRPKD